jgi:hypothetical protein
VFLAFYDRLMFEGVVFVANAELSVLRKSDISGRRACFLIKYSGIVVGKLARSEQKFFKESIAKVPGAPLPGDDSSLATA